MATTPQTSSTKDIELGVMAASRPLSADDNRPEGDVNPSRASLELMMSPFSADHAAEQEKISASAQENYLSYLKELKSLWKDLPNINIAYKNLSMNFNIPVNDTSIPSIADALLGVGKKLLFHQPKTYELSALDGVTGHMKSGEMTLILAPPGHGKSMLLKGLAGRLNGEKGFSGEVKYNGMTKEQLKNDTGYHMNKLAAYVGQADIHMSLLTVKETFDVALKHSIADINLLSPSESFIKQHQNKVSMIIDCLGLKECTDTIIGNDLIRGVSGGQKKRVTIGEMMIGNYRVLLLDEITTGLDAAMAFDILQLLQQWTRITGGSVVVALLQPTPEMYQLFDNIILLREGACVYNGPRPSVLPYLSSLGIHAPDDQDDADFLVDFLTDPPLYFAKRQERELKKLRLAHQASTRKLQIEAAGNDNNNNNNGNSNGYHKTNGGVNGLPIAESSNAENNEAIRSGSVVVFHLSEDDNNNNNNNNTNGHSANGYTNGHTNGYTKSPEEKSQQNAVQLRSPSNAPVTTASLKAAFQKSSYASAINDAITRDESSSSLEKFVQESKSKSAYTARQFTHDYVHSGWEHLLINIRRQGTYMKRNNLMIFPRIFSAIFMGVCIGTLYIQMDPNRALERIGLILFSLIFLAFSNMAELPISEELKDAVGKQLDGGFYPAFTHIFAVSIPIIPLAAAEATIFGSLIYWISGFNTDAGRFFFYLLISLFSNLVLGTVFRAVSYLTPNQVIAQQLGGPVTVLTFLFGGFLVTENKIPDFLIEFFWLSPFSWSTRAAAINEFNDGRYSAFVNGTTERIGDAYLRQFEVRSDSDYKWAAIGYSGALLIVFSIVSALAVKYMRFEVSMGTKRPPDEEEIRSKLSLAAVQLSIRQESERNLNKEAKAEANAQSVLPFTPTTLTWNQIHYTIPVHGKDRKLLKEVTGYAQPGVLTALMGASGAGKTTLMDVLAGRKTLGKLEGDINVNGEPFQSVNYRRILGYVEQNDLHMPLDTVRQALLFSAKLRLPASITDQQREKFVDEIIDLLELTPIANRIIGNEAIPGIAGWQKKLVTIGVELVANPSIICLDEPTSSLDSRAAIVVMRVIRKIASTGRAVLCTIHQPSAEVFYMFDRLLLLKSGGETVYFGPIGEVHAENLVDYLEEASNNTKKIPPRMNPASWMLDVIGAGTNKTDIDYAKTYSNHSIKKDADKQLIDIESSFKKGSKQIAKGDDSIYAASFLTQYLAVQYRAFTAYYRNVPFNLTRIILINLLGIIFGLVYLDTRTIGTDAAAFNSKLASVYMTIGFSGAIQCMIVVPVLIRDRSAYYRERASSMYSDLVYSLATFIVELPYVFIATIMFNYSYYFMVELDSDASLFWKYIFASFLNAVVFTSIGHLMAAAFPNFVVATQVQGILMTFFFLFGGTFIRVSSIPKGWIWMYYIDPLPKAIIAAVFPQYQCEGSDCPYIDFGGQQISYSKYLSDSFDAGHHNYWRWIAYLIATVVVFRVLIAVCLRYISHIRR